MAEVIPLPLRSRLDQYQLQADELLVGWNAGDAGALRLMRHNLPRFLDERITWLPKDLSEPELRAAAARRSPTTCAVAERYRRHRSNEWCGER